MRSPLLCRQAILRQFFIENTYGNCGTNQKRDTWRRNLENGHNNPVR